MTDSEALATRLAMIAGTISTPCIRDFTIHMMSVAPASFRTAKASRNNHPPDEREPGGNILHTIRVTKLVKLMADSCSLDRITTDTIIAAAIIHDICRYGLDDEHEATLKEHALLPRELAKRHSITCEYDEDIFRIAEGHMGKWGPHPYTPQVFPGAIIHLADMVSAHANEVWEQLGASEASWVGGVPLLSQGMTQELMTLMEELAEGSEYWKTALSFVRSMSNRKIGTLSAKQQDWIHNIIASLKVELDKREAERAFGEEFGG